MLLSYVNPLNKGKQCMKKLISKIKSKYTIALFGIAIVVSAFTAGATPAFSASCSGTVPTAPVFNYWPLTYDGSQACHDFPLIDARNLNATSGSRDNTYSYSQAEHDAGINANIGDQVRVSIYFHNGATDEDSYRTQTTAHGVKVGSTFNTGASTVHIVAGSLSADNAATVTSTSAHQGGDITITTPQSSTLQYVSGTTKMCIQYAAAQERGADLSQTCGTDGSGQSKILINLPDGIANGTVSIGDLKSCFPYSGEVVYTVNVVAAQIINPIPVPTPVFGRLAISKTVRDISHPNTNGFAKSTTAFVGDQVQYQIIVTNTGSYTLNNVSVNDLLPFGDNFVSGTTDNGNYVNGSAAYLGTLGAGQSRTVTITATISGAAGQTIQNTATASADATPSVSDTALVLVGAVAGANTGFTYSKSAYNDTKNVDATTVPADKEDFITYTLTATNIGNTTATNFVISDDLSNVLNYASMTSLNGGTMNGNTITWPAVTIAANSSVKETFRVRVNFNLPTSFNNLQLVNTYGNTVTIQINNPRVLGATITAPTTGPAGEAALGLGFATVLTAVFHFIRKALLARKSA